MNKKEIIEQVNEEVSKVKKYVSTLVWTIDNFDKNPSIKTGIMRRLALDELHTALRETAENVWHRWSEEYSTTITSQEMDDIFRQVVDGMQFDCTADKECWSGVVGNMKRGENK